VARHDLQNTSPSSLCPLRHPGAAATSPPRRGGRRRASARRGGLVVRPVHAGGRGKAAGQGRQVGGGREERSGGMLGQRLKTKQTVAEGCRSTRSTWRSARRSSASCTEPAAQSRQRAHRVRGLAGGGITRRGGREDPRRSSASRCTATGCRARTAARSRSARLKGEQVKQFESIARWPLQALLECDAAWSRSTADRHGRRASWRSTPRSHRGERAVPPEGTARLRDPSQEDEMERIAGEADLNYVRSTATSPAWERAGPPWPPWT